MITFEAKSLFEYPLEPKSFMSFANVSALLKKELNKKKLTKS